MAVPSTAVMMSPACRPAGRPAGTIDQLKRRDKPQMTGWPWLRRAALPAPRVSGSRRPGRRAGCFLLDRGVDGLEADAEPRAGQRLAGRGLGHQRTGDVDRDGEADALGRPATAVLMPMTLPLGSSSGPPLLPGLMAASVWMRLVRTAALDRDGPADRRDDAAGDRVGERAERAADGDGLLADLDRRRVADRGGRETGRVDLDDGEVGERVDAVDGGVKGAAVLEVDRQRRGSPATTWWLVRMSPLASKMTPEPVAVPVSGLAGRGSVDGDAVGDDRDDGGADCLDDVDDWALRGDQDSSASWWRGPRARSNVVWLAVVRDDIRPGRGKEGGREHCACHEAGARGAASWTVRVRPSAGRRCRRRQACCWRAAGRQRRQRASEASWNS